MATLPVQTVKWIGSSVTPKWTRHSASREMGIIPQPGGSDTMLLGNLTYTLFENSWPPIATDPNAPEDLRKVADEIARMTKIVFSQSRQDVTWENSKLFHGNLVQEVQDLKQGEGSSILIFGSGMIVQQLTNAGLIDEYLIAVTPVILGQGKPLFGDVQKRILRLKDTRYFKSGNVLLRYGLG